MKRSRNLLCLFLWVSLSAVYGQGISQNLNGDINYAASLYDAQNYKAAAKEYLRVYFYDRDNQHPYIEERISTCFYKLSDTDQALKYIDNFLRKRELGSAILADAQYFKIRILLEKNPKLAIIEMLQLSSEFINLDKDRFNYYMAMCYFMDDEVTQAQNHLSDLSYASQISETAYIELTEDMIQNKDKNHLVPRIMSVIIPGLGQAVNGELQDGLNSALINGSLIYVFVEITRRLSFADAVLSVMPYLARFYTGGMRNASLASKRKQAKRKREYLEKMNRLIIAGKP